MWSQCCCIHNEMATHIKECTTYMGFEKGREEIIAYKCISHPSDTNKFIKLLKIMQSEGYSC
jgi:hypothetical protein